ncbi:MAG TPA: hypothetical protein VFZ81_01660 [Burkholderiales bacterium]
MAKASSGTARSGAARASCRDGGNFRGNQLSATLTVYDNENYREKAATIKPGQRIADLDERMGFFQDISSVKIACAGGDGQSAQQGQQEGSAAAGGSGSAASGAGASTFESLDTDNDGSLSRSEYSKYRQ